MKVRVMLEPGRSCPMPATGDGPLSWLSSAGAVVDDSPYWRRRRGDGDVRFESAARKARVPEPVPEPAPEPDTDATEVTP